MEQNNIKEQLISFFNQACSTHQERLDFICSTRESDTFSSVDVSLEPIKNIIEITKDENQQIEITKIAVNNIKTLSSVGATGQYMASFFSTNSEPAIIFCVIYFLYHFGFLKDNNKKQIIKKAYETIADNIADYLNEN
ncbi:DUF1951 domain-containing protein [Mycoplasmoides genitalium]